MIVTGRKVVSVFAAGASSCFQENNSRVPMPYFLATPETDAQARGLPPRPPLHAVEMNHVGAISPTSCHRLTDSIDVS